MRYPMRKINLKNWEPQGAFHAPKMMVRGTHLHDDYCCFIELYIIHDCLTQIVH